MGSYWAGFSGAFFNPDVLQWRSCRAAGVEHNRRLHWERHCRVSLVADRDLMLDWSRSGMSRPDRLQLKRGILVLENKNFLRRYPLFSFPTAVHFEFPTEPLRLTIDFNSFDHR